MVEQIVGASKPQGLFEIRIGVRRRRRWSDKIKGQIVAESYAPGAGVSEVARRHGLSPQQLSAWRKAARTGALSLPADTVPPFVPEMTEEGPDDATAAVVPDGCGMSTLENNGSLSSHQARGSVRCPGPRHELIDTRGRPEIDQLDQHVGEIGLRVDATEFAAFDERRNTGPVLCPMIMAGDTDFVRQVWFIYPADVKRGGNHPSPFPEKLPGRLIRMYTFGAAADFPGEVVLDPFCGTGTTCAVAKRMGRRYVSIDINERYVAMARERVTNAVAGDVPMLFCGQGDRSVSVLGPSARSLSG